MANQQQIEQWLSRTREHRDRRQAQQISPDTSLLEYGIDSVAAVSIMADLEDYLEQLLDPNLFYEYPTIRGLSARLADMADASEKSAAAAADS